MPPAKVKKYMYVNFLVFGLTFILVIKAKLNLPNDVITKRKLQYCDMKIMGWQMPWGRLIPGPVRGNRKNAPLMPASGEGGGWALLELTDALHVYIMTLNFSGRAYYQASVVM